MEMPRNDSNVFLFALPSLIFSSACSNSIARAPFSFANSHSGCPLICASSRVFVSRSSRNTDACTALSAFAICSSRVFPWKSAACTSHSFCTSKSGVPSASISCSAFMISAGSTSLNTSTKSFLTASSGSPSPSRFKYPFNVSIRSFIRIPPFICGISMSFFVINHSTKYHLRYHCKTHFH